MGFEPTTSSMPSRRAPNCATAPPSRELNFSTTIDEKVYQAGLGGLGAGATWLIDAQVREEGAVGTGEGASTEKNRADRASGVRVVNADEAAGSGFVDGHFRDDGDAHVRADHREETGKVATFKNDAGVEAGAVAGGDRTLAEAVSIAEKKKRIEAQIGETKGGSTSELVLFGERGEEAFRNEGERFEVIAANGQRQNGKVDGAGAEAVEQDGSNLLGDGELDLGKFAGERSEKRRKEIGGDGGNDANGERTTDGLLALDDIPLRGGEFVKNGTSTRKEGFAEFG